jgi:hypothetical protein
MSFFDHFTESYHNGVYGYPMPSRVKRAQKMLAMGQLLVESGADCGAGSSLGTILAMTTHLHIGAEYGQMDTLDRWVRMIVSHSESSPFNKMVAERFDYSETVRLYRNAIWHQAEWDLSDFERFMDQYWGKGAAQYFMSNDATHVIWRTKQNAQWLKRGWSSGVQRKIALRSLTSALSSMGGQKFIGTRRICLSGGRSRLVSTSLAKASLNIVGHGFIGKQKGQHFGNRGTRVVSISASTSFTLNGLY